MKKRDILYNLVIWLNDKIFFDIGSSKLQYQFFIPENACINSATFIETDEFSWDSDPKSNFCGNFMSSEINLNLNDLINSNLYYHTDNTLSNSDDKVDNFLLVIDISLSFSHFNKRKTLISYFSPFKSQNLPLVVSFLVYLAGLVKLYCCSLY